MTEKELFDCMLQRKEIKFKGIKGVPIEYSAMVHPQKDAVIMRVGIVTGDNYLTNLYVRRKDKLLTVTEDYAPSAVKTKEGELMLEELERLGGLVNDAVYRKMLEKIQK